MSQQKKRGRPSKPGSQDRKNVSLVRNVHEEVAAEAKRRGMDISSFMEHCFRVATTDESEAMVELARDLRRATARAQKSEEELDQSIKAVAKAVEMGSASFMAATSCAAGLYLVSCELAGQKQNRYQAAVEKTENATSNDHLELVRKYLASEILERVTKDLKSGRKRQPTAKGRFQSLVPVDGTGNPVLASTSDWDFGEDDGDAGGES
ncbi:MAG: hypothetical protein OXI59_05995 [Gemmatimonadota bacterium]|nr:hypothetical protein [Gemmatimonadota bacterium]